MPSAAAHHQRHRYGDDDDDDNSCSDSDLADDTYVASKSANKIERRLSAWEEKNKRNRMTWADFKRIPVNREFRVVNVDRNALDLLSSAPQKPITSGKLGHSTRNEVSLFVCLFFCCFASGPLVVVVRKLCSAHRILLDGQENVLEARFRLSAKNKKSNNKLCCFWRPITTSDRLAPKTLVGWRGPFYFLGSSRPRR
jgi:hypothetical protein